MKYSALQLIVILLVSTGISYATELTGKEYTNWGMEQKTTVRAGLSSEQSAEAAEILNLDNSPPSYVLMELTGKDGGFKYYIVEQARSTPIRSISYDIYRYDGTNAEMIFHRGYQQEIDAENQPCKEIRTRKGQYFITMDQTAAFANASLTKMNAHDALMQVTLKNCETGELVTEKLSLEAKSGFLYISM